MAGVLERIRRPQKQLVKPHEHLNRTSLKVLELQTAKEILAETFRISIPEVDGLWPPEFWVVG